MREHEKLLDIYMDRLLKKHNISPQKMKVDKEEKARMKEIVTNIQAEVEKFLEKQSEKKVTESVQSNTVGAESNPEQTPKRFISTEPPMKPKIFMEKKKRKSK